MPKKEVTKEKISISIDKELFLALQKEAGQRMMKFSTLVEYYIKKGKKK